MTDTPPPKQKPWSDIDLNRWRDYDEVETGSLWLYPSRASGDGHKLDYHGNYIPQLATQLFTRYSKADDIVLDMFLGSGTSLIEAARLGRRGIGVELKPELVEYVRGKIAPDLLERRIHLLQGDSAGSAVVAQVQGVLRLMEADFAQLLMLHPPYDDIIKFSENPDDLSNAPTTEAFLDMFEAVAHHGFDLLEPGRFAALIFGDKYANGELVPLGFWCMERMNRAGFKTKGHYCAKTLRATRRAKAKNANLWRYRAWGGLLHFQTRVRDGLLQTRR